jgi:L-ascorbate metabolism protein UlaG (beta-lactamase superfamily)
VRGGKAVLVSLGALAAGVFLLGRAFSAPRHQGAPSDHFDGRRFRNYGRTNHGGLAFLEWMVTREPGPWPKHVENRPFPPPPPSSDEIRVTFINHASLLVQVDGVNILTDPIWSQRTSPVSWAGPKRIREAGVCFIDLPKIDAVVVSHNHYDHLDVPTLKKLSERDGPLILTGLGNDAYLKKQNVQGGRSLDWWQRVALRNGVSIHVVPAQHFSGRGLGDADANLWAGYLIESSRGKIYFAGDTGWGPHFQMIRERLGAVDVAILPIGAFRPVWFMSPVHISPAEAVKAHSVLGARVSVPMHYGTFALGDDGFEEPVAELRKAIEESKLDDSAFAILEQGESRLFPRAARLP